LCRGSAHICAGTRATSALELAHIMRRDSGHTMRRDSDHVCGRDARRGCIGSAASPWNGSDGLQARGTWSSAGAATVGVQYDIPYETIRYSSVLDGPPRRSTALWTAPPPTGSSCSTPGRPPIPRAVAAVRLDGPLRSVPRRRCCGTSRGRAARRRCSRSAAGTTRTTRRCAGSRRSRLVVAAAAALGGAVR
jgi:hypothetical protein